MKEVINMKKTNLFLSLFIVFVMLISPSLYEVHALESENLLDYHENIINDMFFDLSSSDKVLKMPYNGYLFGQAKVVDAENPEIIYATYDSGTDKKSITVSQAKKDLLDNVKNNKYNIEPKGAGLPSQVMVLASGSSYRSNAFSGSGWRFGGYYIQAGSGTSGILQWKSYIDSGLVGDSGEAQQTLNYPGSPVGYPVYPGGYYNAHTKMNGWYKNLVYYTNDPKNGTYYTVECL